MSRTLFTVLATSILATSAALAKGDGSLQAPLTIPAGRPGPVTVHAGDFNDDGKFDLVVANGFASNEATGSPSILVLLQNPKNRQDWTPVPLKGFTSAVFVRGVDMSSDGIDDIMVADVARSAFFVKSKGDGTFEAPVAITQANGARWIALGDWNNDGIAEFASANFRGGNLTAFLNDGNGKFTLSQNLPGSREHTVEAMDYDADGNFDLMMGSGLPGVTPYKGQGNGKFVGRANVSNFGCVEYISDVGYFHKGEFIFTADFNKDGKADMATTCIDDNIAYAGYSMGTGAYRQTIKSAAGGGTDSTAIGDFTGDGNDDVAITSQQSSNLWIHPGKGDGTFLPPVVFSPTGATPVFLIGRDLDGDGHVDLVSAEQASFSVTIFWGKGGDRFMESGISVTGFTGAKGIAVTDFDKDGAPDLIFPRSDVASVNVYLKPGLGAATRASFTITTAKKYSFLEVADLNGDQVPDLMGVDPVGGTALVALIDEAGKAIADKQLAIAAGIQPSSLEVGKIDEGDTLDMAIPCKGSNHVAVFLGQGGGAFAEAKLIPTVEKPKNATLGKWDGDAFLDIAVIADTKAAIHFGKGGGEFEAHKFVSEDTTKIYTDVAAGDVNGDAFPDLVLSDSKTTSVTIYPGKGTREFDAPIALKPTASPNTIVLADMESNGSLDIITSSATGRSISILLNKGAEGFAPAVAYGMGVPPVGIRVLDLNLDGAVDVVGFSATQATILLGRPAITTEHHFLRGDASGDGRAEINDPILVINRLFNAGESLPCEDAADSNDDGLIDLTDPIAAIGVLFLGGAALPPPGPEACGDDVDVTDSLADCTTNC